MFSLVVDRRLVVIFKLQVVYIVNAEYCDIIISKDNDFGVIIFLRNHGRKSVEILNSHTARVQPINIGKYNMPNSINVCVAIHETICNFHDLVYAYSLGWRIIENI